MYHMCKKKGRQTNTDQKSDSETNSTVLTRIIRNHRYHALNSEAQQTRG